MNLNLSKIKPKPEFDQHILIDKKILNKIVCISNIVESDIVLEIGSGIGNLTKLLAEKAKLVYAVEKDPAFGEILVKEFGKIKNVKILIGDALKIQFPNFNKIVSNLPYQICEPLFQKLIHYDFELGILMVPEIFAKKITSKDQESLLSIQIPLFYDTEIIDKVRREEFYPEPRVDSNIIKIKPRKNPGFQDYILRELFLQDDKKTINALIESLIRANKAIKNKILTKKESKKIVDSFKLGKNLLNLRVASLSLGHFKLLIENIKSL